MSKVIGIYVKCTKTTQQIWSCHVTLASNSEYFYFSPNFVSNFRKSYQMWGTLAQEQKCYRQKTNWGWKTPPPPPPSAYRVKQCGICLQLVNQAFEKSLRVENVSEQFEQLLAHHCQFCVLVSASGINFDGV